MSGLWLFTAMQHAHARLVEKTGARKKLENWNSGTNGPRRWLAIWRDGRDEWLKPN